MSDSTYTTRTLEICHCNKEGWMSDFATNIKIDDEGAGEFLVLKQPFARTDLSAGGIAISPEEWPTLKAAIDQMFDDIKKHEK